MINIYNCASNTPLDLDEMAGLKLPHISTRQQLDQFEQINIQEGLRWAYQQANPVLLTEHFIKKLHHNMFGNVWKWAGHFRNTGKTIGIDPLHIGTELRKLLDDTVFWIEKATYPVDEIATRFHHRLVYIHPFPNGNGRHTRIMTDLLLLKKLSADEFSWGTKKNSDPTLRRERYISSLREADKGSLDSLLLFVRS